MNQKLVFRTVYTSLILTSIVLFALLLAQAYVRWSLNQNFEFLGGFELEALALLVLGQLSILAFFPQSNR